MRETEGDEVRLFGEDVEVGGGERSGGDVEVAELALGESGGFGEDGVEVGGGEGRGEGAT